jgi:hypothetical protein
MVLGIENYRRIVGEVRVNEVLTDNSLEGNWEVRVRVDDK